MSKSLPNDLCRQFARILGGTEEVANGVCTVTRLRNNLRPLIENKRTRSILAIAAFFSFEDLDRRGNALNLGETVILQEEINPFISALRARGIEVTALHNHWLFDKPRLMFIHFKSVEPPLSFATKAAEAFRVLTTRTIRPERSTGTHRSSMSQRPSKSNRSSMRSGSTGSTGSRSWSNMMNGGMGGTGWSMGAWTMSVSSKRRRK